MKRVLHVSDPHLRRGERRSEPGWRAVQAFVRADPPALVVDTGDLVFDSPEATDDHRFAAACHDELGVDVVLVPGNHDIGDCQPKASGPREDLGVAFSDIHGASHWVRHLEDWALIGVNAMLFGSESSAEAAEWRWFEAILLRNQAHPIALFVHKPPFLVHPGETELTSAVMPAAGRDRFWALVKQHDVRLIGCGHRHEYRCVLADGVLVVWTPTTSALLEETTAPLPAQAYSGLVEYLFSGRSVVHRPVILGTKP
jgi:3',5'-cyclic AMP phosphodiesterase CpdA